MKTTLVIMAAGIGSRFGQGIKQLEPVGPNGEIIMDYSINDAIQAGFDKVVFIIRKEIEKDFKEVIGNRIEKNIEVKYAFQQLDDLPDGFIKGSRTKPWGTGQAVLSCKDIIKENFLVINADDYYGKEMFKKMHEYLIQPELCKCSNNNFAMAGFKLKNTLSDNGGVTRGICEVNSDGYLQRVVETSNIEKMNGKPAVNKDGIINYLDGESVVSMNAWGLSPKFIDYLEDGFKEFLLSLSDDDITSEYLLPFVIDRMVKNGSTKVKVLKVNDKWFGVTYQEDKNVVKNEIKKLHERGAYGNNI